MTLLLRTHTVDSFILDCLDSLLLLGMDKEYQRARQWVATELSFDTENRHHAFEVRERARLCIVYA